MYINFRSQNVYTFLAIIMYCQRLFLLFTGKQHCLLFFQAVQLFNKIKWKKKMKKNLKKKMKKNLKKTCFSVFPTCYVKIHLYLVNLLLFVCFRHLWH